MVNHDDKQITIPLPFLQDETVLYVESPKGTSHHYIEEFKDDLFKKFRKAGYTFLYLPDLVKDLSPEILDYQFPGQRSNLLAEDLYRNIQDVAQLGDRTGFLYKRNGHVYFRSIPESPDRLIKAAVDEFISSLRPEIFEEEREIRFRKLTPRGLERAESYHGLPEIVNEERLDPKTQAIIDAWEEIEHKYGISIEDLDVILRYRVKLSRLIITTSNRIFLPDLEGNPEVKLDDLTKALYFFYLRNPKGAAFKELQDHEDEIYRIYMGITGRDDIEGIRRSVSGLVAPYSTGRDSCVSRIKKAFRDIVGDRIAKYYYIDGRAGDTRKVSIDRDLVIWEH
jgi:hypothetical protein